MIEIFSKKPPKEESVAAKPDEKLGEDKEKPNGDFRKGNKEPDNQLRDEKRRGIENDFTPAQRDEKQPPPTMEEKLTRLTERLNLRSDQIEKVRSFLESSRQKGETLRKMSNPNRDEVEAEKEKNRIEEDGNIMKILDDAQKKEYSKMVINRRK